jgi:hypothetical protein
MRVLARNSGDRDGDGGNLSRRGCDLYTLVIVCNGGERGPVTFPAFKAGDSALRESNGGFDFHTPPPQVPSVYGAFGDVGSIVQRTFGGDLGSPSGADGVSYRLLRLQNPLGILLPNDLLRVAKHRGNEARKRFLHSKSPMNRETPGLVRRRVASGKRSRVACSIRSCFREHTYSLSMPDDV